MSEAASLVRVTTATIYDGNQVVEDIAAHEGGHAILRRLTGLHFDTIGLRVDHGFVSAGKPAAEAFRLVANNETPTCPLPDVAAEFRKPLALRRCCVALAGLQSELMLAGVELPGGPIIRQDADHARARQALIDSTGCCTDEQLFYAQLKTRDYLSRCWLQVHATAHALIEQFNLNGEAVLHSDNTADAKHFSRLDGWTDD